MKGRKRMEEERKARRRKVIFFFIIIKKVNSFFIGKSEADSLVGRFSFFIK
jgi:hypothetical protein